MSGQPGDDDAVDGPGRPDQSGNSDDHRESGDGRPGLSGRSAHDPSGADRVADFEAFDRFAKSGEVDERVLASRARRGSWRRKSGALLPGAWAAPVGEDARAGQAVAAGGVNGASGADTAGSSSSGSVTDGATWAIELPGEKQRRGRLPNWLHQLRRPRPSGPATSSPGSEPGGLRGRRLALAAGGLALACTMLGGVIGGFIALHTAGVPTTNPSYSLGTVPPALTNRPATSVAGIAARVMPSVVMIKVNGGIGTGSGFIIRGDYIVTDNHVVTLDGELNNAALRVYFSNGQSAPGVLVGRDPYSDIAIIRAVGITTLPALPLGNSTGVDVGDPVIAVGSPLGLADTVTSGIVSAVNRPVQPGETGSSPQVYFDAIQTDAPINPGNSGGPLVNGRGQVIGVDAAIDTLGDNPLTGTQGGSIGLGFAIPINQARRVALQLIRTGFATHSVIGAQIAAGWGGNGAMIMPAKAGSTATVTPGGPAAMAGLEPGDVIVKFDGQTINSADTLLDAISSLAPGTRTGVTYTQAGQTHTSTIQLGSAPS